VAASKPTFQLVAVLCAERRKGETAFVTNLCLWFLFAVAYFASVWGTLTLLLLGQ